MQHSWTHLLLIGLIGLVVGVACQGGSGDSGGGTGEPYKIGVTGALSGTGGTAVYTANVEGLRLYFERLNAAGGINGHPVKLVLRDNQVNPTTAAGDAQAFLQERVQAIAIASPSVTFPPVVEAAGRAKTPVVQTVSGCVKETLPPEPREHFFCVGTAPTLLLLPNQYIAGQAGGMGKKVIYVASETPASRMPIEQYGAPNLRDRGFDVEVMVLPLNLSQTDADAVAAQIIGKKADYVISYAATQVHLFGLYQSLARQGWQGQYFVLIVGDGEKQLNDLKSPNLIGFTKTAPFAEGLRVHEEIREAAQHYGARFPPDQMGYGWAAGVVLEQALRKCGWPCGSERLLQVMNDLTVSSETLKQLWGNDIVFTRDNHVSPAEAYKLVAWDPKQSRITVIRDWTLVNVR